MDDAVRAALEQMMVTLAQVLDLTEADEAEQARDRLAQHGLNPEPIEGRRADAIYPDKAAKMRAYRARKRNAKGNAAQSSVTSSVTPSVTPSGNGGGVTAGVTGNPEGVSPVTDACSVTPGVTGSSAKGNGSSVTPSGNGNAGSKVPACDHGWCFDKYGTAGDGCHSARYDETNRPADQPAPRSPLLPTDDEKAYATGGILRCRQTLGVSPNGSSA